MNTQHQKENQMDATISIMAVATIAHNDQDGKRVTLYTRSGDQNVWAAAEGEEPYRTDVDVDRLESAWSGPQWDLRLIESSPTKSYEIGRIVIDK